MNTPTTPQVDWTAPPFDLDRILDWLTFAAWTSAALSVLGVLLGLVMLAFGSSRGPGAIVGGAVGTVVAVVIATAALPSLHQALS